MACPMFREMIVWVCESEKPEGGAFCTLELRLAGPKARATTQPDPPLIPSQIISRGGE